MQNHRSNLHQNGFKQDKPVSESAKGPEGTEELLVTGGAEDSEAVTNLVASTSFPTYVLEAFPNVAVSSAERQCEDRSLTVKGERRRRPNR